MYTLDGIFNIAFFTGGCVLAALFLAWAIALFVRCHARRGVFGIVCCACLSVVWALIILLLVIVLLKSLKVFVPDGDALVVFGAKIPYLGRLVALFGYPVTYVQFGAAVALGLFSFAIYGVRGDGVPAAEPAPLTDGEDFEIERPGIDDGKYAPQPEEMPETEEASETTSDGADAMLAPADGEETGYDDGKTVYDDPAGAVADEAYGYEDADGAYYADETGEEQLAYEDPAAYDDTAAYDDPDAHEDPTAYDDPTVYDEQSSAETYDEYTDEYPETYTDEYIGTEETAYGEELQSNEEIPDEYTAPEEPAMPQPRPHKHIEPARPSDRAAAAAQMEHTAPADVTMPTDVRIVIRPQKQSAQSERSEQKAAVVPQPSRSSQKPAEKKAAAQSSRPKKPADERKPQPDKADHAVKHVEPVMQEDLPITRRHVILNRTNIANMFNEYLSTRSEADKEKLENSISTIIVK